MNCKNCKKQGCSLAGKDHEMSFECKAYVGKTNADRIRSMTDEELAMALPFPQCPPHKGKCTFSTMIANSCDQCWLDWLKQEAKE